jgi:hypothetical protein
MMCKYLKRTMSNTLDLISTAALPGTHTFLLNINSSDSCSPRCIGYSDESPNSLPTTNSSSTKWYSTHLDIQHSTLGYNIHSNINILEHFQSKVLRLILDAPWYVSNSVIHKSLQIPRVEGEISLFNSHYDVELIASLTEPPIHKRLRRYWPHDLLVRF